MKQLIKNIIPNILKEKIRKSTRYLEREATKLALNSKRLDICSAQLAHVLHLSGKPTLTGKTCLEIGSGLVLTHAVVCYLLGAKKVIATDIINHAQPKAIFSALHKSMHSVIRDILSPFEDHAEIRARLDHLLSIKQFNFEVLKHLGIEYMAPIDFATQKLNIPIDFVYSNTVLEHVPCSDVAELLYNISSDLVPGGRMIHSIHMEDHENIKGNPFEFLSIPSEDYSRELQSSRGNRLRKSSWLKIFNQINNTEAELIYEWQRKDCKLPNKIDTAVSHIGENDLKTSHLGVFTKKHK